MYIPAATYRIQFNASFGFRAAEKIVPYLSDLGISTLYASPIFKARKNSPHGYDVADTNQLNPEAGSEEDFESLTEALHQLRMGWLQDFVPNHMAYDSSNAMLMDIFEKGPDSPYFEFFDVVWDHLRLNLHGKLIAPFLGSPYGETLEKGELTLTYGEQGFSINYYDKTYPIRIESYAGIISHRLDELKGQLGEDHANFVKVAGVLHILETLPSVEKADARNIQIRLAKDLLREVFEKDNSVRDHINETISHFNREFDLLDRLLFQQWFLFAHWKLATKEINYQRFFNVNELISLRIEDQKVFDHIHTLVLKLVDEGKIDGLRIDHVDGLYDPTMYLHRLRERAPKAYIAVEKILELSEALPARWPVEGTTGYEFLNYANGLFVDGSNRESLHRVYEDFTGASFSYEDLLYEKKKLIIERHLTGDLDNLAHHLKKVSTTTRDGIDLTMEGLKKAIIEMSALFPVYRTYINDETISERDSSYVCEAIEKAVARDPEPARELKFLERVLLLKFPAHLAEEDKSLWLAFVMRFQQFTSPLTAKGLEDTAFYIFNRLISLNEVGGNPSHFGISTEEFHAFNKRRSERYPHTINATSTHDTKRGEDVRARINALSEMPEEWEKRARLWREQNHRHKTTVRGEEAPDRNQEYFFYQTLVGAFPFHEEEREEFVERIKAYLVKAAREAKVYTNWMANDAEYENALTSFAEATLDQSASDDFLNDLLSFQKKIARLGAFNSLSQTLLKIASPGAPDFYQGSELWDLSLVDPDNRRPVDFEKRERCLREIKERDASELLPLIEEMLSTMEDGRVKLFTIYRALKERKRSKELFDGGQYIPLIATGELNNHVIAFARRKGDDWAAIAAPRFFASLIKEDELPVGEKVWRDTAIELPHDAPDLWRHVFTDQAINTKEAIPTAELFRHFPLGFIVGERAD